VDDGRSVGTELPLGAIQPQHRLTLAFGDRLAALRTIDMFAGRIDSPRSALRTFPVILEGAAATVLRIVDLSMRMQPTERIVTYRAERHDLLARLQRQGVVDLDRRHLGVEWQVARATIMDLRNTMGLITSGARHHESPMNR
jgi:hypothetical protein